LTINHEELYSADGIYGDAAYGGPVVNKGLKLATYLTKLLGDNKKKIICFGSGNGYEAVVFLKAGHDCYTVDYYTPEVAILKGRQIRANGNNLPFADKEFDLFFSCETMEHVKEEETDAILKEAMRVSNEVFFTIADDKDPFDTHINIHHATWWMNKFEELGFRIIHAQWRPYFSFNLDGEVFHVSYPSGVLINAKC